MSEMSAGFCAGFLLLGKTLPILTITLFLAAILSWIFGPRSYTNPADNTITPVKKWYLVAEYSRVLSVVAAMSAFGTFQGYLIGSVGFEDASKTTASLIAGAVTFLSSIIALFYSKDAPDSFRRSIAPGIIGFLMCFLIFDGYHDEVSGSGMQGPTIAEDPDTTHGP